MATSHLTGSATIYQFPVGGRAAVSGQRNETKPAAASAPRIVYGNSWYHEEAIQDAEKARKN
jgi:hypothetical protein